jgi:hypothetical protein
VTADLWALADRPAPPVIPGQTAVDDPRPIEVAGDPEPLFPLPLPAPAAGSTT